VGLHVSAAALGLQCWRQPGKAATARSAAAAAARTNHLAGLNYCFPVHFRRIINSLLHDRLQARSLEVSHFGLLYLQEKHFDRGSVAYIVRADRRKRCHREQQYQAQHCAANCFSQARKAAGEGLTPVSHHWCDTCCLSSCQCPAGIPHTPGHI
jgi:hypothetical protein